MANARTSISLRLTIWFGSIFLAGWLLFGAAMWFNLQRALRQERYVTLSNRFDRLVKLLKKTQSESNSQKFFDYQEFARATGHGLAEIFRTNGSQAMPSPTTAAHAFPWPPVPAGKYEQFSYIKSRNYWVLERRVSIGRETFYLADAAPQREHTLILDSFWEGLVFSAPILLLLSSASGYWLSRRALKPVDRVAAVARSISIRNLSERLPVAYTGDEIERLAETCNDMLARLEAAVNQIKQFTGDASHELRGPLSFVRTVAEVALRNPRIDSESQAAFKDIVDETAKATALLEDMLTLARADSERGAKALEPINLAEVVEQACNKARPLAEKENLLLNVSITTPSATVLGDVATLRRLMWILLDNALKYTLPPGAIAVTLSGTHEQATVAVRDTGVGISEADLPRIFDRFYRADPSRSQIEGAGLGLSIAKWIAETHHANLTVTSKLNSGTVFEIAFPICSPSSDVRTA